MVPLYRSGNAISAGCQFAVPETRVFRAADGENLVILDCTILTDPPDRRTNARTKL